MALPEGHQDKVLSDNLYERLGVSHNATSAEIETAVKERMEHWMKIPPHHPKYGKNLDEIKSRLAEARAILTNLQKRQEYDKKLIQLIEERAQRELESKISYLIPALEGVLADGVLTRIEKEKILAMGRDLGLSSKIVEDLIEVALEKTGSIYVEDGSKIPAGSGRPKLVIENSGDRLIKKAQLQLNTKYEHQITINNSGGGVNSGTITTTEPWLKVSRSELDTSVHRQSFIIIIDTHRLELAHRYSGKIRIQTLGGSETINVDISIEGAEKRALKLTKISTGLTTGLGFSAWAFMTYTNGIYLSVKFFLVFIIVFIGIKCYLAILKRNNSAYFWLFVSMIGLGFMNLLVLILLIPIPVSRWISYLFFTKFPTKTAFVGIIPLFLCFTFWGCGYLGVQNFDNILNSISVNANKNPEPEEPVFQIATVTAPQGASIRSGAGVTFDKIGVLPNGVKVKLVETYGNWSKIIYGNPEKFGYVYRTLLDFSMTSNHKSEEKVKSPESGAASNYNPKDADAKISCKFESNPDDAQVYINEQFIGKTPVMTMLPAGKVRIMLKAIGYQDLIQALSVQDGGQTEFNFQMTPLSDASPHTAANSPKTDNPKVLADVEDADTVYDDPPQPVGGFEAIHKNLIYPETSQEKPFQGVVILKIYVDLGGNIINSKVHKSSGDLGYDTAAIEAVKSVKWKPAVSGQNNVSSWFYIPVNFK